MAIQNTGMQNIGMQGMEIQNEKLDKFIQAIDKEAKERRERILKEAEDFRRKELEKADADAYAETQRLIQKETAEMRTEIQLWLSQQEINAHRELLTKRKELVSGIFSAAADETEAFTHTDAYGDTLEAIAYQAAVVFTEGDVIVYVRSADLVFAKRIKAVFNGRADVEADDSIKLGGMRIRSFSLGVMADETFDTRLQNQNIWFTQTSKLNI